MVKLIKLDIFHDLRAKFLTEPGDVLGVRHVVLEAGENGNGDGRADVGEIDLRNRLTPIMLFIFLFASVIELLKYTSFDDLSIMDQLFHRCGALWQCTQQIPASLIFIRWLLGKPVTHQLAKSLQNFV